MSSELVQVADSYTESVLPKQMEQYKVGHAPKLNDLLKAVGAQKDELESALFAIRSGMYLETAVGAQLDIIGSVFNVARAGRSDSEYRLLIKFRASLRSFATVEDVISVLKGVYGATYAKYVPTYPAGLDMLTDAPVTDEILEQIVPAGVGVRAGGYFTLMNGDYLTQSDGAYFYVVGGT